MGSADVLVVTVTRAVPRKLEDKWRIFPGAQLFVDRYQHILEIEKVDLDFLRSE